MTKQLRYDLINSPLYKVAVGFDRLFDDMFDNPSFASSNGYPPYNVTRISNPNHGDIYEITLAVAGFTKDDIEVIVENNQLQISGKSALQSTVADDEYKIEYLHKGIAERDFTRRFRLTDHVEVKSASMRDGLLVITLERILPEAVKPKIIKVR